MPWGEHGFEHSGLACDLGMPSATLLIMTWLNSFYT